ncbi:hypothetical protein E2320_011036 [Naja naja]|nr:hypothetical protein E2320_011036 [Naja naja]
MAVVGGGGVNPFLSDSEESEPEETRPGGSSSSDPGVSGAPLPVSSSTSSSLPLQQLLPPPPPAQAEEPPRVPVDALAAQLLRDQFVLTALELHTSFWRAAGSCLACATIFPTLATSSGKVRAAPEP